MKNTIITIILITLISLNVSGLSLFNTNKGDSIKTNNKLEIDLQIGFHISNTKFHHNDYINKLSDDFYDYGSSHFLGVAVPVGKSWFLRTEIGIMRTRSSFSIEYDDDYTANQRNQLSMNLNTVKGYLGFMPEYRLRAGIVSFKFFAGPIFTSNMVNTNTLGNTSDEIDGAQIPLGLKFGAGMIILHKTIGFTFGFSHVRLARSELISIGPTITYSQFHMNCGVIYAIQ